MPNEHRSLVNGELQGKSAIFCITGENPSSYSATERSNSGTSSTWGRGSDRILGESYCSKSKIMLLYFSSHMDLRPTPVTTLTDT